MDDQQPQPASAAPQTSAPPSASAPAPAADAPTNRTLMGILAYLGILVVIPLLMAQDDPFVKFHIRQGLVLFGIEVLVWILMRVFWPLFLIYELVNLGVLILAIIGIVGVLHHKETELPVVGSWAKSINF